MHWYHQRSRQCDVNDRRSAHPSVHNPSGLSSHKAPQQGRCFSGLNQEMTLVRKIFCCNLCTSWVRHILTCHTISVIIQNTNREYEILDEVIVMCVDAMAFIPVLFFQVLTVHLNNIFVIISQNNSDAVIPPPAPPLKAQISPLVTMFNQDTPKQEPVAGKV